MLLRSSSSCDFLVVGLGNPGSKYWNTRHNVGYAALDALAKDLGGGELLRAVVSVNIRIWVKSIVNPLDCVYAIVRHIAVIGRTLRI